MVRPAALLLLVLAAVGCGKTAKDDPAKPVETAPQPDGPTATAKEFMAAMQAGDADKSWALLDARTHSVFEKRADDARRTGDAVAGAGDGRTVWGTMVGGGSKSGLDPNQTEMVETVVGDKAWVRGKALPESEKGIPLSRENGTWRVNFADMMDQMAKAGGKPFKRKTTPATGAK